MIAIFPFYSHYQRSPSHCQLLPGMLQQLVSLFLFFAQFIPSTEPNGVQKIPVSSCHHLSSDLPLHLNKIQTPNSGLYNIHSLFICLIFHKTHCLEYPALALNAFLLTCSNIHHLQVVDVPLAWNAVSDLLMSDSFSLFSFLVISYGILSGRSS